MRIRCLPPAVSAGGGCLRFLPGAARPGQRVLALAGGIGFAISAGILTVRLIEKFTEGAWMTVLITGLVIAVCVAIRRHYQETARQLEKADAPFATAPPKVPMENPPDLDPQAPTAVVLVGRSLGAGMHTLLTIHKLFPQQFKNYVFLSIGEGDAESFRGEELLAQLGREVEDDLAVYVNCCRRRGMPAAGWKDFGADTVETLMRLCDRVVEKFPNCVFFASKLLFNRDTWFTPPLHNQTAFAIQRRLHLRGFTMVILPMKV